MYIIRVGCALLFHRVVNKKLPMFDFKTSSEGCFIRPRPIESMLFFGIVFNACKYTKKEMLNFNGNLILTLHLCSKSNRYNFTSHKCTTELYFQSMYVSKLDIIMNPFNELNIQSYSYM